MAIEKLSASSEYHSTKDRPIDEAHRLDYLDAARGIAALMVLFYHYLGWRWDKTYPTSYNLLSFIFNGSDAVSFFFVLSGMVLSYKYLALNHDLDIRKFYINRVFRLWPAYAFTIVAYMLVNNRDNLNADMFRHTLVDNDWRFYEEISLVWAKEHNYFFAGWTLTIEMVLSLLTPFIIVLAKYNRKLLLWLLLCVQLSTIAMSEFYIHFTLGIIISAWFYEIRSEDFKKTKAYRFRYLLLAIAFVFFSIRHIDRLSPLGPSYKYFADVIHLNFFVYTGIGSFVFICYMVQSPLLQRILGHSVFRFYGRIAYGVYLMHIVVVSLIFQYWSTVRLYLPGKFSAPIIMMLAGFAVTTILAVAMYHCIEKPFMRWGKALTNRLRPSFVTRA